MDIDVEADVDIDRFFANLKGVSKSVQVLLNDIEAAMVLTWIILTSSFNFMKPKWEFPKMGAPVLEPLDEGSCYFGSILSAPAFNKGCFGGASQGARCQDP